jgi:hypothetical protein
MSFLIFAGFVCFSAGIMFLLFPGALMSLASWADRLAARLDEKALRYRLGIGISLVLTGLCLWFVAYYLNVIPILRRIN